MAVGTLPTRGIEYAAESVGLGERSRLWRKLSRNPLALIGGAILLVVVGSAIAAPWMQRMKRC